jgi:hypothetical protein
MKVVYPEYTDKEIEAAEDYVDWMADEYDEPYAKRVVKKMRFSEDNEDERFY